MKKIFNKHLHSKLSTLPSILVVVLLIILAFNRSLPYLLNGPFGFGYDLGNYKRVFAGILAFKDILNSTIDIFPSFLAYLNNFLNLPQGFLLYFFYIFLSTFIAIPLYSLTKEYFNKRTAIIAITLFTVSYVQVAGSQFYLFKTMLGAVLMLYGFLFYSKKSYLFYPCLILLALTQLPQILILAIGVVLTSIFDLKKSFKYNLIAILAFSASFLILLFFKPDHLFNALDVILTTLKRDFVFDNNYTGLLMTLKGYLKTGWPILAPGLLGLILSKDNKKITPFQTATLAIILIVFLQLFFYNRYVLEMDLLLIPFAAYTVNWLWAKRSNLKGSHAQQRVTLSSNSFFNPLKNTLSILLILISLSCTYLYSATTNHALTPAEIEGIEFIKEKTDADFAMVTNDIYAPWIYGFSAKQTMASEVFIRVWDFDQLLQYHLASAPEKSAMLLELSKNYGPYYLFEGARQDYEDVSTPDKKITKIFSKNGVKVYKVTSSSAS